MAVGDVYEAVINWTNLSNAQNYATVLHYQTTAEADPLVVESDLAQHINGQAGLCLPFMSSDVRFSFAIAQRIFPAPRTAGTVRSGAAGPGARATDSLPPQCCMVIRKRTGFAGRKFRGRLYMPGLSEDDQNNGTFSGARWAGLASLWDAELTTVFTSGGGNSYKAVICDRTGGLRVNAITTTQSTEIVRTQRRRVRGVGK